ncbi:hypothetical protein [Brazilian marseillevirus]|uniref:hypothetical protein n=1 Tax=Brazilian marseillevirus TaxID=1813599 RepID=UPI0007812096|nr:hypothetical protein A3303_gp448 [Brazilian marseillevirus]AMQ10956.1 hypothetical protein [Brazilian marseillevirus]
MGDISHLKKDFEFVCDACNFKTNFENEIREHITKKHYLKDNKSTFICKACGYKSDDVLAFRHHLDRKTHKARLRYVSNIHYFDGDKTLAWERTVEDFGCKTTEKVVLFHKQT